MTTFQFFAIFGYLVPMVFLLSNAVYVMITNNQEKLDKSMPYDPFWPSWFTATRLILFIAVVPILNLGAYQLAAELIYDLIFPEKDSE